MPRRTELSPLESHLGYWIRYVSNHVSHAFALKLAAVGVTVAEWAVLRELYDSESAPSTLADRLGMTRGAISKLADRLIDKALIVRRINAGDRRFQSLALTRQGRAITPKLAALADENDAEFFADLDIETRAAIAAAMKAIVRRKRLRGAPVD
ncbi:MAG TPA: MarR family transcriptional regulator [Roseiarcus sp.]|nr:MarR family transcriptional regulator [Roseiarcus sp.]